MTAEGQRSPGCLIGGALLKGLKDVFWMMRARFRRNFAQDDPFEQPAPGSTTNDAIVYVDDRQDEAELLLCVASLGQAP
jgi:hypothetical protein